MRTRKIKNNNEWMIIDIYHDGKTPYYYYRKYPEDSALVKIVPMIGDTEEDAEFFEVPDSEIEFWVKYIPETFNYDEVFLGKFLHYKHPHINIKKLKQILKYPEEKVTYT